MIRYDERGYGLSDWTTRFTLDEWIEDLDAVADAAGLDCFPLQQTVRSVQGARARVHRADMGSAVRRSPKGSCCSPA